FRRQAALAENLLDPSDVAPRALDAGGGSLLDAALRLDPLDVDAVGGGDARPLTVDVLVRPVLLADLDDLVNPAHVGRIEIDQLRKADFGEDFFPEFHRGLEAGGDDER